MKTEIPLSKIRNSTVFIAGGGTGGHLYPGIAIAKALKKLDSQVDIRFVGTKEGLETKIIPRENFPLYLIQGGKLNFSGNPLKKILTLLKLPVGFFQSIWTIAKFRPQFVLGVGGYASGPFVLAASILRVPCAIWEPNVYPGLTNRILARVVKKCFLVFKETLGHLPPGVKSEVLGMPVREELEKNIETAEKKSVRKKSQDFHLLHFGGSQGSRFIGNTLLTAIEKGGDWLQGLKVIHQTGSLDFNKLSEKYASFKNPVEVKEFIFDMSEAYSWADLVICRGGASTISELAAFGLPGIVIPLPAADDHQEHNARALVDAGALKMVLQKDLTPERLVDEITKLRSEPNVLEEMRKKLISFHRPGASVAIAERILLSVKG